MKTVDARGQLCPKPVMMAREAIQGGAVELSVVVDNETAASNVTRFLESAGYAVTRSGAGNEIVLQGRAGAGRAVPNAPAAEARGDCAYLILSRHIGDEDGELGELLMKSFLGTVAAQRPRPRAVALMNGGVKLALPESSCSDSLRELADSGVSVLVCGTCAKHYGITDRIAVGVISNMFEITESVFGTPKPIVLG